MLIHLVYVQKHLSRSEECTGILSICLFYTIPTNCIMQSADHEILSETSLNSYLHVNMGILLHHICFFCKTDAIILLMQGCYEKK